MFTEDPLPWEALQNNKLDVLWNIATLKSPTAELSKLVLQSTLEDGDLKAGLDFEALRGGGSSSRIQLATAGEPVDRLALTWELRRKSRLKATTESGDDVGRLVGVHHELLVGCDQTAFQPSGGMHDDIGVTGDGAP